GYEPAREGDSTLVQVDLEQLSKVDSVALDTGGTSVEVLKSLRDRKLGRVYFLVRAPAGDHRLRVKSAGGAVTKAFVVGRRPSKVSVERRKGIAALWAKGAEPAFEDASGPIDRVAVAYLPRDIFFSGVSAPWWIHWFLLCIVIAFVIRRPLGVTL